MKHLEQGHQQKVHIEGRRFSFHDNLIDNLKCADSWKRKFGGKIIQYKEDNGRYIPYIIASIDSSNNWSGINDSDCQEEAIN